MNQQQNKRGASGATAGAGLFEAQQSSRVRCGFIESKIPFTAAGRNAEYSTAAQASAPKWKSTFQPVDHQTPEDDSQEQSSVHRADLYDPFANDTVDSARGRLWRRNDNFPCEQQRLSPGHSCNAMPSWELSRPLDYNTENGHSESHPGHRLPEWRAYSPDVKKLEPSGYGSISPPYGGEGTKGEEGMARPEHRSTMVPRVRLSSPKLLKDCQIKVEPMEAEEQQSASSSRTKRTKSIRMDQITINCDMCDIEVSNGQELEDHLDSKIHWDIMEHIQQQNNYDDVTIAFLQDVLMYKSIKCSRAVDDSALGSLQEKEHMTKVALFHCAACQVLVSTAASSVHNHITSPEHLSNTKEFGAQRRHASVDKANTIMKELQPQFENFLKGFSQFE